MNHLPMNIAGVFEWWSCEIASRTSKHEHPKWCVCTIQPDNWGLVGYFRCCFLMPASTKSGRLTTYLSCSKNVPGHFASFAHPNLYHVIRCGLAPEDRRGKCKDFERQGAQEQVSPQHTAYGAHTPSMSVWQPSNSCPSTCGTIRGKPYSVSQTLPV